LHQCLIRMRASFYISENALADKRKGMKSGTKYREIHNHIHLTIYQQENRAIFTVASVASNYQLKS
jgi:hypothetical protein